MAEHVRELGYSVGIDGANNVALVISHDEFDTEEVRRDYPGKDVIHMTPDELAAIVGKYRIITAAKKVFPGGEIKAA